MKFKILVGVLGLVFFATGIHARGHGHFGGGSIRFSMGYPGFYGPGMGFGYGYGGAFYYPYYYNPPVVNVIPETPPVYIEKGQPQPLPANFWYYCQNPGGYYPAVKTCPGGWQQVAPVPVDHK